MENLVTVRLAPVGPKGKRPWLAPATVLRVTGDTVIVRLVGFPPAPYRPGDVLPVDREQVDTLGDDPLPEGD